VLSWPKSENARKMRSFLLFLCFVSFSHAYKILVYSTTFSKSHIVSNARIADVLAKDGHDVVSFYGLFDLTWRSNRVFGSVFCCFFLEFLIYIEKFVFYKQGF
jgi:hypothetical protein